MIPIEVGFSTLSSDLKDQSIPTSSEWKRNVRVFTAKPNGTDELSQIQFFIYDGFFGATFFAAGKILRFDYLAQEHWYCNLLPDTNEFASMNMYFKVKNGIRDTH